MRWLSMSFDYASNYGSAAKKGVSRIYARDCRDAHVGARNRTSGYEVRDWFYTVLSYFSRFSRDDIWCLLAHGLGDQQRALMCAALTSWPVPSGGNRAGSHPDASNKCVSANWPNTS